MVDQTTAIIVTCFVGFFIGVLSIPIGFIMFTKELQKGLMKEFEHE